MPLPDDRLPDRGQVLAYPEAVRLINPVEPEFKGEVVSSDLTFVLLIQGSASGSENEDCK